MKRTIILALALGLTGCWIYVPADVVAGNGDLDTWTRGVALFSEVQNDTGITLNVYEGSPYHVRTTLDSNLQELLTVAVENGVLVVDVRDVHGIIPSGGAHVDVWVPELLGARARGSGDVLISGVAAVRDLRLDTYGSGDLAFSGGARRLEASTHGSGDLALYGAASTLVGTTFGSGKLMATELDATDAELTVYGSGDVAATLAGGGVSAGIYGSGDIEVWGWGTVRQVTDLGSGRFTSYMGGWW